MKRRSTTLRISTLKEKQFLKNIKPFLHRTTQNCPQRTVCRSIETNVTCVHSLCYMKKLQIVVLPIKYLLSNSKKILLIIYLLGTYKTNLPLFSLTKASMFDNEKKKKNMQSGNYLYHSCYFQPTSILFFRNTYTRTNTTHKS